MCTKDSDFIDSSHPMRSTPSMQQPSKRLNRNRRWRILSKEAVKRAKVRKLMEINNLKLYIKNKTIIEENQRLRKKALVLHQENKALMSQLLLKLHHSSSEPLA